MNKLVAENDEAKRARLEFVDEIEHRRQAALDEAQEGNRMKVTTGRAASMPQTVPDAEVKRLSDELIEKNHEAYEAMAHTAAVDQAIEMSEQDFERTGIDYGAKEAFNAR